jgi:hypothetical protein
MPQDWKHQPIRPVAGNIPPPVPRPKTGTVPPKTKWRFSLRFWRQVRYFGVDQCEKSWFVSLLERLSELSNSDIDDLTVGAGAFAIRYHPIDWNAKNIPIARKDLDWLGNYAGEDFDLVQFHLSRAMGRVVGFFDEEKVFNVVLLDPFHNVQPSGDFNYRVRTTYVSQCQLTKLSVTMQNLILSRSYLNDAQRQDMLDELTVLNATHYDATIHLSISDEHLKKAYSFAKMGLITDLGELLQLTIDDLSV